MNYTVRNLLVASMLMMLGIVAVTSFIRGERRDLARGQQQVVVWVATRDIPSGTAAKALETDGYVEQRKILREDRPPNLIGDLDSIAKLVSKETIYTGEYVPSTAFDESSGLSPTNLIKGNERLASIPVNAANDAGGLIRPGDLVDIMYAHGDGSGNGLRAVSIAARGIEIIETPESLIPKGVEVEAKAPQANGQTKLYVIKATDSEIADIKYAGANADDDGLLFVLTPEHGAAESKIPTVTAPNPNVS